MICPHGLLDKQSAIFALCFHNHSVLVDFTFILSPINFRLGSTSDHSRKFQRFSGPDDDTFLDGGIKFHCRRF